MRHPGLGSLTQPGMPPRRRAWREGMDVLLVTVALVVGVVLLIAGSVEGNFLLIALSVACAATGGVVGVLSVRQRRTRAERSLVRLGPAELRARAASFEGGLGDQTLLTHGAIASPDPAGQKEAGPGAAPSDAPSGEPATPDAARPKVAPDAPTAGTTGGDHRPQPGASGDAPDPPPDGSPSGRPPE